MSNRSGKAPAEETGANTSRGSDQSSGSQITGTSTSIFAPAVPGQKKLAARSPCAVARSKIVGQPRSSAYQNQSVGAVPGSIFVLPYTPCPETVRPVISETWLG